MALIIQKPVDVSTAAHVPPHLRNAPPTDGPSFRPADADKRTANAGAAVARTRAALDKAQTNANAADEACIEDPSEKALAAARTARRALDDAARDHQLAQQHAAKVSAQIDAEERAAIAAEVARLEAERGDFGVIDDAVREVAVEIGLLASELSTWLATRHKTRMAAQPAIDDLLRRIGKPTPNYEADTRRITQELVDLVHAAQGGAREDDFLLSVVSGERSLLVARALGREETRAYDERVSAITARVRARRAGIGASLAVKAAALIGACALALGLAQG